MPPGDAPQGSFGVRISSSGHDIPIPDTVLCRLGSILRRSAMFLQCLLLQPVVSRCIDSAENRACRTRVRSVYGTDGVHLHITRIGLPAGETVVLLENHKLEEI
jgi:hypothetical protein